MILGAVFRGLGAHPAGWRYPGAHRDPLAEAAVLKRTARTAEAAKLDYLFFGEWLATGPDLEFRDPDLLARVDPVSSIAFLAGLTKRIGLIATVNTAFADLYTLARQTASIDRLSDGRAGLNIVTGADPRAAGNHGRDGRQGTEPNYDQAGEIVRALRLLWDSWEDDAFVHDQRSGRLIDPAKLHRTDAIGEYVRVTGPLNVARPVQGHLPIVHAGTSSRSKLLAGELADISLVAVQSPEEGVLYRADVQQHAQRFGRGAQSPLIVSPVLPVVGETREEARAVYDQLLRLVPLDDGSPVVKSPDFPANRSIRALSTVVGVALGTPHLDDPVPVRVVRRFSEGGQRLLESVVTRTGRAVEGEHPVTYRHLLATHVAPVTTVVGSGADVADHLESWFTAGAVDGFNVLSPFLGAQFEAFARLVVPELQRRGLFRTEYEGRTLRDHLGLDRPGNVHLADAERERTP